MRIEYNGVIREAVSAMIYKTSVTMEIIANDLPCRLWWCVKFETEELADAFYKQLLTQGYGSISFCCVESIHGH